MPASDKASSAVSKTRINGMVAAADAALTAGYRLVAASGRTYAYGPPGGLGVFHAPGNRAPRADPLAGAAAQRCVALVSHTATSGSGKTGKPSRPRPVTGPGS